MVTRRRDEGPGLVPTPWILPALLWFLLAILALSVLGARRAGLDEPTHQPGPAISMSEPRPGVSA